MKVVTIPNGQFAENCYLVIDAARERGVVVDPGEDAVRICQEVAAAAVEIEAIWLTHAHVDHILGVARVAAETGAPVFLHPADLPLYEAVPDQATWFGLEAQSLPAPERSFVAGAVVRAGDIAFRVGHAPGHSPGSVVLVGPGVVFAGDVLFAGSIGRTDLPGGDFETLIASIDRELLTLPDETVVYPGHGPETTIGRERRTNPFLSDAGRPA